MMLTDRLKLEMLSFQREVRLCLNAVYFLYYFLISVSFYLKDEICIILESG